MNIWMSLAGHSSGPVTGKSSQDCCYSIHYNKTYLRNLQLPKCYESGNTF